MQEIYCRHENYFGDCPDKGCISEYDDSQLDSPPVDYFGDEYRDPDYWVEYLNVHEEEIREICAIFVVNSMVHYIR